MHDIIYKHVSGESWLQIYRVGDDYGEGPPVPIPNTEVKLTCAENTLRVTARENRFRQHRELHPKGWSFLRLKHVTGMFLYGATILCLHG